MGRLEHHKSAELHPRQLTTKTAFFVALLVMATTALPRRESWESWESYKYRLDGLGLLRSPPLMKKKANLFDIRKEDWESDLEYQARLRRLGLLTIT